jgi:type I restriction enzyme R subunit
MTPAGYSDADTAAIKAEIAYYTKVRDEVRLGAGEKVDFKQYEAGMRFLLDTYIDAKSSEVISEFGNASLIELIEQLGAGAIDKLPERLRKDEGAVAATITNNVRKVIIDETGLNPRFYGKMSKLLDDLLEQRRIGALSYKDFLTRVIDVATQVGKGEGRREYPLWATSRAKRTLVDFFWPDATLAATVDETIRHAKPDEWVGNPRKERRVRYAIKTVLPDDFDRIDDLVELVKRHDECH